MRIENQILTYLQKKSPLLNQSDVIPVRPIEEEELFSYLEGREEVVQSDDLRFFLFSLPEFGGANLQYLFTLEERASTLREGSIPRALQEAWEKRGLFLSPHTPLRKLKGEWEISGHLFDVEGDFSFELSRGICPEIFLEKFDSMDLPISETTTISGDEEEKFWVFSQSQQNYRIRKEEDYMRVSLEEQEEKYILREDGPHIHVYQPFEIPLVDSEDSEQTQEKTGEIFEYKYEIFFLNHLMDFLEKNQLLEGLADYVVQKFGASSKKETGAGTSILSELERPIQLLVDEVPSLRVDQCLDIVRALILHRTDPERNPAEQKALRNRANQFLRGFLIQKEDLNFLGILDFISVSSCINTLVYLFSLQKKTFFCPRINLDQQPPDYLRHILSSFGEFYNHLSNLLCFLQVDSDNWNDHYSDLPAHQKDRISQWDILIHRHQKNPFYSWVNTSGKEQLADLDSIHKEERENILSLLENFDGKTKIVTVLGYAGTGKTHLAGWLARKAEESGRMLTIPISLGEDFNIDYPFCEFFHLQVMTCFKSRGILKDLAWKMVQKIVGEEKPSPMFNGWLNWKKKALKDRICQAGAPEEVPGEVWSRLKIPYLNKMLPKYYREDFQNIDSERVDLYLCTLRALLFLVFSRKEGESWLFMEGGVASPDLPYHKGNTSSLNLSIAILNTCTFLLNQDREKPLLVCPVLDQFEAAYYNRKIWDFETIKDIVSTIYFGFQNHFLHICFFLFAQMDIWQEHLDSHLRENMVPEKDPKIYKNFELALLSIGTARELLKEILDRFLVQQNLSAPECLEAWIDEVLSDVQSSLTPRRVVETASRYFDQKPLWQS